MITIKETISKIVRGFWGEELAEGAIGIPVIKTNNMSYEGKINYSELTYRDIDKSKIQDNYLQNGDLLIEKSGGTKTHSVGYVNIFEGTDNKYVCNNFILAIRPNKKVINPKYLFYDIQYKYNSGKFDDCYNKTTGIQNLKVDNYLAKRINNIDLKKQKEIVSILDKINGIVDADKKQLKLLDETVKSRFIEMFAHSSWKKERLADVIVFLRNGLTIKQEKNASGIPITRIETLANARFNYDRLGYANIFELSDKQKNYLLKDGDLLISHINSAEYVGRTVQYHAKDNEQILHGMNLLCMRLKDGINSTYIEHYFRSEEVNTYFKSISKKAVNQASMSTSDMKVMQVSLPPIELQNKFAEFVDKVDKSKFNIQQHIDLMQELLDKKMDEFFNQ